MEPDDLNAPLGQAPSKRRLPKLPIPMPQIVAGVLALGGLVVASWALVVTDPLGGEPMAVVSTKIAGEADTAKPADKVASKDAPKPNMPAVHRMEPGSVAVKIPEGSTTVNIIDGSSGKSKEVVIPGTGQSTPPAEKAAAKKPDGTTPGDKPAPGYSSDAKPPEIKQEGPSARLSEKVRYGTIPKIGPDGAKPSAAYALARALPPNLKDRPRIAIVLTDMGISASGTADAFTLPAATTFALAPYAVDVARLAERARDEGHEVLLQVPMEPFEYPSNDPGPQTLLTSLSPDQNIDRLHWLMSRMQGYIGLISYMGARFLSTEGAMTPVLGEANKRGLIFIDGGASQRSVAPQLAVAKNMAFAKADIVIDGVPTPIEIERALARLEIAARENSAAIGIANAQPGTIARIAEWAAKVESRGFVLVPVSMALGKTKSS